MPIEQINDADLVLLVFEDYDPVALDRFRGLCGDKPFINIQNKVDVNEPEVNSFDCCVSAKSGAGFDVLKSLIVSAFDMGAKKDDFNFIIRDRHEALFKKVVLDLDKSFVGLSGGESIELVAEDLKSARSHLDEMVGKKFSDSLLGDIFSDFCIGK